MKLIFFLYTEQRLGIYSAYTFAYMWLLALSTIFPQSNNQIFFVDA